MHQAESRPVLALFIREYDAQVTTQCFVDAACKLTCRKLYTVKKLAHRLCCVECHNFSPKCTIKIVFELQIHVLIAFKRKHALARSKISDW
jgi:hypothetical protein